MNSEQRYQFWKTLCSLKGENLEKDSTTISAVIDYPDFLYRYRPVTVSSIDALQRNLLFYSNANYYDDPFDTLLHIDFAQINEFIKDYLLNKFKEEDFFIFCRSLGISENLIISSLKMIKNLDISDIINEIDDYLKNNIQILLKENLWSACFSERGDNEVMWVKYADQYRGFCVIYYLDDRKKPLSKESEKRENSILSNAEGSLYPIFYSDEGYDATEYSKLLSIAYMTHFHLPENVATTIIQNLPICNWEQEKVALIKSKCHEYDQEWRLLYREHPSGQVTQECIPYGVILGLRMNRNERLLVIRSAKMAGIEHIFELYITNEYRLNYRELRL